MSILLVHYTQGHKNMPFTGGNDQINFILFLAPVHLTQWQMFETSATTKEEKLESFKSIGASLVQIDFV